MFEFEFEFWSVVLRNPVDKSGMRIVPSFEHLKRCVDDMDPSSVDDERHLRGQTALLCSCQQRFPASVVQKLLQKGADPNIPCGAGVTCLTWAVIYGHRALVDLLLDFGADPNIPCSEGVTCLTWAVIYRRHALVNRLLDAGASRVLHHPRMDTTLKCKLAAVLAKRRVQLACRHIWARLGVHDEVGAEIERLAAAE